VKFYGLELKGKFWIQRLPDLTNNPWTSDDTGRLVYNEDDDILYYGGNSSWVQSTQSRFTFNVGQVIIFGAAASGGTVLPDDWNISSDIDDKVPMITNIESQVGDRGGDWGMPDVVAAGSHDHFTPENLGEASRGGKRGASEIYATVALQTHKHNISYDGSHIHSFDGSWRFPHVFWTIGEYQP
jgi:hypothetical protein